MRLHQASMHTSRLLLRMQTRKEPVLSKLDTWSASCMASSACCSRMSTYLANSALPQRSANSLYGSATGFARFHACMQSQGLFHMLCMCLVRSYNCDLCIAPAISKLSVWLRNRACLQTGAEVNHARAHMPGMGLRASSAIKKSLYSSASRLARCHMQMCIPQLRIKTAKHPNMSTTCSAGQLYTMHLFCMCVLLWVGAGTL